MDIILDTVFNNPNLPIDPEPGFFDDFGRADGPVGYTSAERRPWAVGPTNGVPCPMVVVSGAAARGTGGTAANNFWTVDAYASDGVLNAKVGQIGDSTGTLLFRYTDPNNYLGLACRASSTVRTYVLFRVVDGVRTNVASAGSVASASGDIIEVTMLGNHVWVKVNGVEILGGDNVVTAHATAHRHGIALFSVSSGAETWNEIGFSPS